MPTYTNEFKSKMVQRMLGPERRSAMSLSAETGVSQTSLSKWARQAMRGGTVTIPPKPPRRPEDWTPEEKLRAVVEANKLDASQLGEFLRREGIHEAQIREWRTTALEALSTSKSLSRSEQKRVRELEREVRRKDKALAETAALLVLQKKVRAIWGDGDDDTNEENEK